MGREIRKVPANWNHPGQRGWSDGRLQPMLNRTFEEAVSEWKDGFAKWETSEHSGEPCEFWEWEGDPPKRGYYRPWKDEEATWFQVWETVSEGTPVTPPFATQAELVNHLVKFGDDWDHGRGWNRASAERFVAQGWAPSFVVERTADGTTIKAPRDA